jgi:hypothetical protein
MRTTLPSGSSRVAPLAAIGLQRLEACAFAVLPDVDAVSLRKAPGETQSLSARSCAQLDDAWRLTDNVAASRPGIRCQHEVAILGRR